MNWMDFMTGAAAGWLVWAAMEKIEQRQAKAAEVPPPKHDPKDVALKKSPWFPLPGGRMELGNTGFYISLNPCEPKKLYQGFTPEGYCIIWGNDLAAMKLHIEGEAKDRADFEPPKGGWRA